MGDVNLDQVVNGLDVDPFVEVLLNGPLQPEADMNEDQVVNGLDVDPFVAAVVGGGAQQIPEPSTLLLCLLALAVVGGWRRTAMQRRTSCLRRTLLCVGLFATSTAVAADAAESKPLVVVSAASYAKLVANIDQFIDPRLTALMRELAARVVKIPTDPRTMAPVGIDTRRPWGLVVESNGQTLPIYGFAPVIDLGLTLAGPVAANKAKPPIDGVYRIKVADQTWYVKQQGTWAVFANSRRGLDSVSAEPVKVLGGFERQYDLAIRVALKDLPAEHRDLARRWIKEGHQLTLPREPAESNLQHALRTALINQALRRAAELIDEGDTLLVGLSLDFRARRLIADVYLTYRPGSDMAESLAAPSKSETDFAGFLIPGAMLTGVWTGEIARMSLYQVLSLFDSVADQLLPAGLGNGLWPTIRDALMQQSIDGATVAAVRSGAPTLAIGGYVADGAKIQRQLMALAEAARNRPADPNAPAWKPDAARYRNVRFHAVSIPIGKHAQDRRRLVGMFGESVDVVVGVDEHHLYLAAGKQAMPLLRQVVRSSHTRSPRQPPARELLAAPVEVSTPAGRHRSRCQPHPAITAGPIAGELRRPGSHHPHRGTGSTRRPRASRDRRGRAPLCHTAGALAAAPADKDDCFDPMVDNEMRKRYRLLVGAARIRLGLRSK